MDNFRIVCLIKSLIDIDQNCVEMVLTLGSTLSVKGRLSTRDTGEPLFFERITSIHNKSVPCSAYLYPGYQVCTAKFEELDS